MPNFDQNSQFLRKPQKTCFLALFVQNKLKIDKKFRKLILDSFLDLKHPIRCCVFSFLQFFADFLSFMPNKAKNSTFLPNFPIFWPYLACNSKNQQKLPKNEKTQHLMGCFKSKKEFKINFRNFCLFLAYFEQKVQKTCFLWFSQKL